MIVMEIQKNGDSIATIVTKHKDPNEAEQKFHTILAAAAVSSVPTHSCVMLSDVGHEIKRETYYHGGLEE